VEHGDPHNNGQLQAGAKVIGVGNGVARIRYDSSESIYFN
jgi:hypothetical protein